MGQIIFLFVSILNIYQYLIILYILMSWIVPNLHSTQIGSIVGGVVEPYLSIFRKIIPPLGMIDFSPIVAFIVLDFAIEGLKRII
ncbi:MAG: YggT family protein [Turicibacter sp.]|nr:YggT family protein [Turicibacter sp.]